VLCRGDGGPSRAPPVDDVCRLAIVCGDGGGGGGDATSEPVRVPAAASGEGSLRTGLLP
jgi:hypothetical protein